MLIVSEVVGHGVQIFDMKKVSCFNVSRIGHAKRLKLLTLDPTKGPVVFNNSEDLAGHFGDLPDGRVHNVVINEELQYGVAVGARPRDTVCGAGLIFFDLKDPSNPVKLGCDGQDGYVHDVSYSWILNRQELILSQAQCLVYHGPDAKYEGRDICYGYNEDTLTM